MVLVRTKGISQALSDGLILLVNELEGDDKVVATLQTEAGDVKGRCQSLYLTSALEEVGPHYLSRIGQEQEWRGIGCGVGYLQLDKWFRDGRYLHAVNVSERPEQPEVVVSLRLADHSDIVSTRARKFAAAYDSLACATFDSRFYTIIEKEKIVSRDVMHTK